MRSPKPTSQCLGGDISNLFYANYVWTLYGWRWLGLIMQVLSSSVLRPKSLDVQLVHRGWSDISESIAVLVEREESLLQVTSRAVFTNLVVKLQNLAVMLNFMNIKENCPSSCVGKPSGCGHRWHSQVVLSACPLWKKRQFWTDLGLLLENLYKWLWIGA